MRYNQLGSTGLVVSELCFGALPMGPLQFGLSPEEGGELIREAILAGVNFVDTAQAYSTYAHIRKALSGLPDRGSRVIISTKSAAATYDDMYKAVEEYRQALDRDVADIFLLHAARTGASVFKDRQGAFECLLDMKAKGVVRAVGISTHSVQVVRRASAIPEIDVIFPIINRSGMGILHGTREEMEAAIAEAHRQGKGLFAMKVLAGGNLLSDLQEAINYVRRLEGVSSVAVGMVNKDELFINLRIFNDEPVPASLLERTVRTKKLIVQRFCRGCGNCVQICPNGAMSLKDGKAVNDPARCILCGYCAPSCPEFAIRLV